MNILVTGGTGGIGRAVAARLAAGGHSVRAADVKAEEHPIAGVEYVTCDITDFAQTRAAVRGAQAVAHLAAIPNPSLGPGPEIYRVNCAGTFNIFEAAAQEGIRRVAQASSINAFGNGYGVHPVPLHYFPIDEAHPTYTSDPYSFSKESVEAIAAYYWRREGISSTSLRMPFVIAFDERFEFMRQGADMFRQSLEALLSAPPERQRAMAAKVHAMTAQMRAERQGEKPWTGEFDGEFDPELMVGFGCTDFWTMLAVDDAALAFERSLLAAFEGSHPLFVCQRENSTGAESEALLRVFYPEVTARKRPIPGAAAIVSYDRARDLIGFEPEILVREKL